MAASAPEWWQRGPVDGVPDMLQPVAHMLLQMRDEVAAAVADLPVDAWNARPAGVASVGYHVRHMTGVLDRLFTYARGEALNDAQFSALRIEGDVVQETERAMLVTQLSSRVDACLDALRGTDTSTLAEMRLVGRAGVPSTVLGCLVHAGEHCMRHLGQLLVTARVGRV